MEGSKTETQGEGQHSKDELLKSEEEKVRDKKEDEKEEDEFLREGRVARLGPAAGYLRKQSPPGYRVTEKEEKHQQKVGIIARDAAPLNLLSLFCS